jgi:hypothetical protein
MPASEKADSIKEGGSRETSVMRRTPKKGPYKMRDIVAASRSKKYSVPKKLYRKLIKPKSPPKINIKLMVESLLVKPMVQWNQQEVVIWLGSILKLP